VKIQKSLLGERKNETAVVMFLAVHADKERRKILGGG
jgi:hypothetical protein